MYFFFFKQKTAYELRISDWSSDVCSSDLAPRIDGYAIIRWLIDRNERTGRPAEFVLSGCAGRVVCVNRRGRTLGIEAAGEPCGFLGALRFLDPAHLDLGSIVLAPGIMAEGTAGKRPGAQTPAIADTKSKERSEGKECVITCRSRA